MMSINKFELKIISALINKTLRIVKIELNSQLRQQHKLKKMKNFSGRYYLSINR